MVGQALNARILGNMVKTNQVPSGLLFAGPSGSGKTSAARILASLLCGDSGIVEVDAASHGLVADVRSMVEQLRFDASGTGRVVIYDEAHAMSRDALTALLKTLEEPPPGVTFVLVTTEPDKIPETIKTRLIEFAFNKISAAATYDRLCSVAKHESFKIPDDLLAYVANTADGNMRSALMSLEQIVLGQITSLKEWAELRGEQDWGSSIVASLCRGNAAEMYSRVDKALANVGSVSVLSGQVTHTLRDLLVLHSRGTIEGTAVMIARRERLASMLSTDKIMVGMKVMWDLKTKLAPTDDPRGNFEVVLAMLLQIFSKSITTTPVVVPEAAVEQTREVTLAEMH